MNFVEPIRDKRKIATIRNLLRGERRYRDLALFVIGINTALRVSDLLTLRIGDFFDEQGEIVDKFWIREEKYNKRNEIVVNDSIREVLAEYRETYPDCIQHPKGFLFFNTRQNYDEAIGRERVWQIISGVCEEVGLRGNYGTHSLRKTWGYHARKSGVALELIMHKLNHTNISVTMRYLGITDDELADEVRKLNL